MFIDKLNALRQEAEDYIMSILKLRGGPYELCPPFDDLFDGQDAGLLDMPKTANWRDLESDLNVEGYIYALLDDGTCDVYAPEDSDFQLTLGELETAVLIELADLVYSLENPG